MAHASTAVLDQLTATLRARLGVDRTVRATTPERCLELAGEVRLAAAVVDVSVAGPETPALCAALRERVRALVLVTDHASSHALALLATGATGVTLAEEGTDGLVAALTDVLAGRGHLPTALVGSVLDELITEAHGGPDQPGADPTTPGGSP